MDVLYVNFRTFLGHHEKLGTSAWPELHLSAAVCQKGSAVGLEIQLDARIEITLKKKLVLFEKQTLGITIHRLDE